MEHVMRAGVGDKGTKGRGGGVQFMVFVQLSIPTFLSAKNDTRNYHTFIFTAMRCGASISACQPTM